MGNQPSHANIYYGGNENENGINENGIKFDSIPESKESLLERLDFIATNYILTMDFKSLKKMYNTEYCNKLVLITADIFNKYFTDLEIHHLASRTNDTAGPNDTTGPNDTSNLMENHVFFFHKSDIKNIENSGSEERMSVCKQIAVYYVKIAHLFAAIVMTINPEYVYTNSSGKLVKRNLGEKSKIPRDAKVTVTKTNICDKRVKLLEKTEKDINGKNSDFCYFNLHKDGKTRTLDEEPGIPELMQLYLDDKFDYKTGQFLSMSEKSKEQFTNDLRSFYTEFTGEPEMPSTITKFGDIKLRNYGQKMKQCKRQDKETMGGTAEMGLQETGSSEKGLSRDPILMEYANNLNQMITSATEKQQQLLNIINKIFVFVKHDNPNKKYIRISPDLTHAGLQQLIEYTRSLIVELYLKCEIDFTRGLHMYEAVIESRMFQTSQQQIENLQKSAEMMIQNQYQNTNQYQNQGYMHTTQNSTDTESSSDSDSTDTKK